MAKQRLLLQLYKPYLSPIEADEIRAEIFKLNPTLNFVMADWPWLEVRGIKEKEVRGIKEKEVERVVEILQARSVKFKALETSRKGSKAKVQVSETLEVC